MDIQRTMEFIVEQQAANTADIAGLQEAVKSLAITAEPMIEVQESHEELLTALTDSNLRLAESQLGLTESHQRLADSQARLAESQRRLSDSQAETEDKLSALIDIVDRLFPKQ